MSIILMLKISSKSIDTKTSIEKCKNLLILFSRGYINNDKW